MKPGSLLNKTLHRDFMSARMHWQKICCVGEALPETFLSLKIFKLTVRIVASLFIFAGS